MKGKENRILYSLWSLHLKLLYYIFKTNLIVAVTLSLKEAEGGRSISTWNIYNCIVHISCPSPVYIHFLSQPGLYPFPAPARPVPNSCTNPASTISCTGRARPIHISCFSLANTHYLYSPASNHYLYQLGIVNISCTARSVVVPIFSGG